MIIFITASFLGSEKPEFTLYLALLETLLEAIMISALRVAMG